MGALLPLAVGAVTVFGTFAVLRAVNLALPLSSGRCSPPPSCGCSAAPHGGHPAPCAASTSGSAWAKPGRFGKARAPYRSALAPSAKSRSTLIGLDIGKRATVVS